jgi:cysteine desulfurase/selenocysteine lyase
VVWQQLQKIFGFTLRYIPLLDNDYCVDWDGFVAMIDPSVKVVACSHVSNVTGAIYDMQKVRSLIGSDVFFIVDGSQSVPHFSVDVHAIGCDCFFWTPHKMLAYT